MTGWVHVYKEVARLKIGFIVKEVEEDTCTRQLIMKRCMLRGTKVRYCKNVLGINAIKLRANTVPVSDSL